MLKILCAVILVLSPAVLTQFTLKLCVAAENRKKITNFLEVQGHLKSLTLILIKACHQCML